MLSTPIAYCINPSTSSGSDLGGNQDRCWVTLVSTANGKQGIWSELIPVNMDRGARWLDQEWVGSVFPPGEMLYNAWDIQAMGIRWNGRTEKLLSPGLRHGFEGWKSAILGLGPTLI